MTTPVGPKTPAPVSSPHDPADPSGAVDFNDPNIKAAFEAFKNSVATKGYQDRKSQTEEAAKKLNESPDDDDDS